MCDSVHTARWIAQFAHSEIRFTLYPSTPHRKLHSQIRQLLVSTPEAIVRMRRVDRVLALPLGLADLILRNRLRPFMLRTLIGREKFDMVHLLECQHAGYLYERAVKSIRQRPPAALSIWGSDLAWFGNSDSHRQQLRKLFNHVDLMFTECSRDQSLARDLGYVGIFAERIPASGGIGFELDDSQLRNWELPSRRHGVVVKGYTGFVGRAWLALQALVESRSLLSRFEISVYSANWWMIIYVRYLRFRYRLRIVAYRKKSLTHSEMLSIFKTARVSLAVSMCDGFPGSAREAVWAGAFPIESTSSCVGEWLVEGKSCLLIDPTKPRSIGEALERALLDDALVNGAAECNADLLSQLTVEKVRNTAVQEYHRLRRLQPAQRGN